MSRDRIIRDDEYHDSITGFEIENQVESSLFSRTRPTTSSVREAAVTLKAFVDGDSRKAVQLHGHSEKFPSETCDLCNEKIFNAPGMGANLGDGRS
jgi:hypothetical protein